ncbi:MAG: formyltransferase family protein [Calditrichota bacterium]
MEPEYPLLDELRVVIITSEDPIYINFFFRELFKRRPKTSISLVGIVNLKPFNAKSYWALARDMLKFYGFYDFLLLSARFIRLKFTKPGLKQMANEQGIPFIETARINRREFHVQLRELNPDVIISVAASQIFKKTLLCLPRLGCWNVHGGYLPKYRGMMPAFWTLFNDEPEGAVSIHRMTEAVDAGDILLQRVYQIDRGESLDRLILKSKIMGAQALIEALETLRRGGWTLKLNDAAQATYYSFPTPREVRTFRQRGHKLL